MPKWTTEDEIKYVKSMGAHTKTAQSADDTIALLKKYIATVNTRDWGALDRERIVAAARLRLQTLEMQRGQE